MSRIDYCSVCTGVCPTRDETSMTGWVGVYMEGAYWCECDTPTPSGNQELAFGYPTNNLQAEMG